MPWQNIRLCTVQEWNFYWKVNAIIHSLTFMTSCNFMLTAHPYRSSEYSHSYRDKTILWTNEQNTIFITLITILLYPSPNTPRILLNNHVHVTSLLTAVIWVRHAFSCTHVVLSDDGSTLGPRIIVTKLYNSLVQCYQYEYVVPLPVSSLPRDKGQICHLNSWKHTNTNLCKTVKC